jgi:sugar lactone lactonase YvrE
MVKFGGKFSLELLVISCVSLLWTLPVLAADASYLFTTLAGVAGTVISSADGTGSAAQFSAPRGVAVDSAGNVYVADSSNHTIRKITPAGVVITLAGKAGSSGYKDGTGTAALFNEPYGVVADSAGNVFVADTNSNAIRKITSDGVVTTLAGGSGQGTTDGTGTAAKFHEPHGIAIDSAGTLYVADYENHLVRKVSPAGVVTTLAGGADILGYVDGQGTAARFMALQGIAVDSEGNVYVTESGNKDVRKITSSGLVTTLVTSGPGKLGAPHGIALDASGNLYVGDYGVNVVRKVTSAGTVSTHAGTLGTAGSNDGSTGTALFNGPSGVAIDSSNNLYIADTLNNTIRKISAAGTVTTFAGLAGRTSSVDGSATAARFEDPYAVAVDGSGNLFVADATDHSIRKITSDGTVTTIAGKGGSFGSTDGAGNAARFKAPLGIAADSAGNVYVADTGNATIRKITPAGVVSTVAGRAGLEGSLDGTGTAAKFMSPYGIAVDASGTLYVVESSAVVRKVTADGVVTTLAGTAGTNGFTNGTGTAARFSVPFDIAVDGAGNLYVSDHGNHAVRAITPAGVVTTLAGLGTPGKLDGTGTAASFKFPSGLAADSSGNVYLADTDNQVVRKITPAGVVTTIAGTSVLGSADGLGTAASFYNPKDVAVDPSGNLYVVDRGNRTIRKGTLQASATAAPVCTVSASASNINAGSSATLTASCSPAATSYVWTGGTCTTTTIASCTVTPSSTLTYTVAGVNSVGTGSTTSVTVTVTPAVSTVILDADKVFVWAERTYATIFGRGQATQTITGYRYRSYTNGHFLAVNDSGTPSLFYLGPLSDNKPLDLGLLSIWLIQANL